jgi:hypothetical protein
MSKLCHNVCSSPDVPDVLSSPINREAIAKAIAAGDCTILIDVTAS